MLVEIRDEQTRWIIQVCAFHHATETAETTADACWITWAQSDDEFQAAREELVRRTASMMECVALADKAAKARVGAVLEVPDDLIDVPDLVDYTLHYSYGDDENSHRMRWVRDRLSAFEAQVPHCPRREPIRIRNRGGVMPQSVLAHVEGRLAAADRLMLDLRRWAGERAKAPADLTEREFDEWTAAVRDAHAEDAQALALLSDPALRRLSRLLPA